VAPTIGKVSGGRAGGGAKPGCDRGRTRRSRDSIVTLPRLICIFFSLQYQWLARRLPHLNHNRRLCKEKLLSMQINLN